jgi:hypothetical protein
VRKKVNTMGSRRESLGNLGLHAAQYYKFIYVLWQQAAQEEEELLVPLVPIVGLTRSKVLE